MQRGSFDGQWAAVQFSIYPEDSFTLGGRIWEAPICGHPGLRIDVPRDEGETSLFFQVEDIHHIELCSEEDARALGATNASFVFAQGEAARRREYETGVEEQIRLYGLTPPAYRMSIVSPP